MAIDRNTFIRRPKGQSKVKNIQPDDIVLAYRRKEIVWRNSKNENSRYYQPQRLLAKAESKCKSALLLSTATGKQLKLTKDQKVWATPLQHEYGGNLVYLMYRPDFGYRVGTTNTAKRAGQELSFGSRPQSEHAERLWVVKIVNDCEEALLLEEIISLQYGIPTAVFNGIGRGLNQERINHIFSIFGKNGSKLLEDKQFDFELPHWLCSGSINKTIINVLAHDRKHSFVGFEWSDQNISEVLIKHNVPFTAAKNSSLIDDRKRCRMHNASFLETVKKAEHLQEILNCAVRYRLSFLDDQMPLQLLPASQLHPSQRVVICSEENKATYDTITNIVDVSIDEHPFVDLKSGDAGNLFANDILIWTV